MMVWFLKAVLAVVSLPVTVIFFPTDPSLGWQR
jgi:hypothetical protein